MTKEPNYLTLYVYDPEVIQMFLEYRNSNPFELSYIILERMIRTYINEREQAGANM